MDVTIKTHEAWVVINVRGRIDAFNFEFLSQRLATLKRAGKSQVAVDLSAVSFINISAARLLVSSARSFAAQGGELAIVTTKARVLDMLKFFSNENELKIYEFIP